MHVVYCAGGIYMNREPMHVVGMVTIICERGGYIVQVVYVNA